MDHDWLLAQRLAHQQLTSPDTGDPALVVARLGAVQAQDYGQSLWAVGLRTAGASAATIERAVQDGTILRSWPMRGTIHFVPAQDARWMVSLLAPRRIRQMTSVYERIGLTAAVFRRAGAIVTAALAGGNRIRRKDLYALLTQHGIDCSASPNGSRGGHIACYLSMAGLICLGPLDGRQPTFVLLDDWVPASNAPAEPPAELAVRYFSSHGPASAQDFAWWSGLTAGEARQAIELAGPALTASELEGQMYYWLGAGPAADSGRPAGAYLLPAFDEYTVAYRDRAAVLGSRDLPQSDLLNPLMVLDGRAVGIWRASVGRANVTVSLGPFDGVTLADLERFAQPCERYSAFLSLGLEVARADYRELSRMRSH